MHRLVAGEGDRPSLAEAFYRNGPDRLNRRLAAVLEDAMERGELRRSSPYLAATQFLAVIVGDLQLRALFRLAPPTEADRDATARAGAELFLQAYAQDPQAAPGWTGSPNCGQGAPGSFFGAAPEE